jgi:hypothetical protein
MVRGCVHESEFTVKLRMEMMMMMLLLAVYGFVYGFVVIWLVGVSICTNQKAKTAAGGRTTTWWWWWSSWRTVAAQSNLRRIGISYSSFVYVVWDGGPEEVCRRVALSHSGRN